MLDRTVSLSNSPVPTPNTPSPLEQETLPATVRTLVKSSNQITAGAEIDLSKLEGASNLDRLPPAQLDIVETTFAQRMFGEGAPLSLIYTGGFGRFRIIDQGLAQTCRTERLEEWMSPEIRMLREQPRSPVCTSLANCAVVSGIGNSHFADSIAARLGLPLTTVQSTTFANSELKPVLTDSVRGKDVFLVQRFPSPVNEYIVGNQLVIDALHRASARSITLVAPYFPYGRQDRRGDERTSVSSAVIAEIWGQKIDGLLTIDIHSPQIESLFKAGFHNFSGHALMLNKLKEHYQGRSIVAVFPDEGGAKRAEEDHLPEKLVEVFGEDLIFAHASKRRSGPNTVGSVKLMVENHADLKGRTALMFDDQLDTGGTALKGAESLKQNGVEEVILIMTHPVGSRAAFEKMQRAMVEVDGKMVRTVDRIFVTDSLPIATPRNGFIEVIGLGDLYAHAILRLCQGHGASLRELSDMFSGTQEVPSLRDLVSNGPELVN